MKGTIIEEGRPDGMEMLKRCYRNSDMESVEAMLLVCPRDISSLK